MIRVALPAGGIKFKWPCVIRFGFAVDKYKIPEDYD